MFKLFAKPGNDSGFSLIELMVGTAIIAVMAMGSITLLQNFNKENSAINERLAKADLERTLVSLLSDTKACAFNLSQTTFSAPASTASPQKIISIPITTLYGEASASSAVIATVGKPPSLLAKSLEVEKITFNVTGATTGNIRIDFKTEKLVRAVQPIVVGVKFTTDMPGIKVISCAGSAPTCPAGQIGTTGTNGELVCASLSQMLSSLCPDGYIIQSMKTSGAVTCLDPKTLIPPPVVIPAPTPTPTPVPPSPPAPSSTDGICGGANGGSFTTAPTSGLCLMGSATSVSGSGPWSWQCRGSNGGSSSSCNALKTSGPAPINGACGTANGGTYTAAPTSGLCILGTPTAVSGTGPWSWQCKGINDGTAASCSAVKPNYANWTLSTYPNVSGTPAYWSSNISGAEPGKVVTYKQTGYTDSSGKPAPAGVIGFTGNIGTVNAAGGVSWGGQLSCYNSAKSCTFTWDVCVGSWGCKKLTSSM